MHHRKLEQKEPKSNVPRTRATSNYRQTLKSKNNHSIIIVIMGIRAWVEEQPVQRSLLLGVIIGIALYLLPYSGEITIMVAMFMPGVYWGFAFVLDGNRELLQETIIMNVLAYFYGIVCLPRVQQYPLYAPLAVLVHGMIDMLHHYRWTPTSEHVKACCEHYPVFCGCLDISIAATMTLLIMLFSS